jgi:hypothetical protein
MEVLVFITSVQTEVDEQLVQSTLLPLAGIQNVTFHIEGGDRLLKVKVKDTSAFTIEMLLISHGFICVQVN